jgi:hypothetical protein
MKPQQRLAGWLAGKSKNYTLGVQIFIDLNIDSGKIDFFNSGSGKIHQNILTRLLENYARVHQIRPRIFIEKAPVHVKPPRLKSQEMPKAVKIQSGMKIERPLIDSNPSVKFDELPGELQQLFRQNSSFTSEIKTFHAELKTIQDDPGKEDRRKELAQGIVERQKTTRANWDAIDRWWKNRDTEKKESKTPEQLAAEQALSKDKRIKANLNYIRRYKNTTKWKQKQELALRMEELNNWNVNYEELLG